MTDEDEIPTFSISAQGDSGRGTPFEYDDEEAARRIREAFPDYFDDEEVTKSDFR